MYLKMLRTIARKCISKVRAITYGMSRPIIFFCGYIFHGYLTGGGLDHNFLYLLVLNPFLVRVCGGASPFRFVPVDSV